ncbi:MAG TPA: glycosyl hydrolase, partial [Bacteroidetes bacterium]|nr:glycosyl hydrolase [Bacteroidota bacterium]
ESEFTGRLGLAVSPSQPDIVYAFLDNQEVDNSLVSEDTIAGITLSALAKMSQQQFFALADSRLDSFLRGMNYPAKYSAELVKNDLKAGKYKLDALASYFGDANAALFRTGVKGAQLYRSENGGTSWKLQHAETLTGVNFTYGYYFGNVRVSPNNPDELYLIGFPLLHSLDAGKSWSRLDTFDVHVDHHALWINPENENHLMLGNDGGLYRSYDRGIHWTHINNLAVGQFYTVQVDMQKPYHVYGGLQDNGVLKGSSQSVPNRSKPWENVFGGDGMHIVTDPKNPGLVYTGLQFGNYFRLSPGKQPIYITPKHDLGQAKYRWNWRTPFRSSPHNHEILYLGAQKLFRSMDMGHHWEAISPDLTGNFQPQGNVPYSTLTTISESPLKFGLLWVGSDDGRVHLSTDGGNSWKEKGNELPQKQWVSKIFASPHDQATAFLSLTGYREDDFRAYVYMTTDYGQSWQNLQGNLPEEPVNVILQDAVWPDLLYLGTDNGAYISLNRGESWQYLSQIPNVAVYDMVVHPRENELVVATHGRSMYVVDVKPLQALQTNVKDEQLVAFAPKSIRFEADWGDKQYPFSEKLVPKVNFDFFLRETPQKGRKVRFTMKDEKGKNVFQTDIQVHAGFNRFVWDLQRKKGSYLQRGKYTVQYKIGFAEKEVEFEIN